MKPVRTLAHCMLGAVFVSGAVRTIRHPEHAAARLTPVSEKLADQVGDRAPWLPTDPTLLVRVNAGVQLAGAVLLAAGRTPRLASTVLAGSLLPTTLVGHPFWQVEDPDERVEARNHFLKNLGVLGGLLLAMVDTQGRPGLRWRAGHAGQMVTERAGRASSRAGSLAGTASRRAGSLAGTASSRAGKVSGAVQKRAGKLSGATRQRAGRLSSRGGRLAVRAGATAGKAGTRAGKATSRLGGRAGKAAAKTGKGAGGAKVGKGARAGRTACRAARRATQRTGC